MSEMSYRPLGRCGTKVSTLSLGGWTTFGGSVTEGDSIKTILTAAYEAGVNFFDMADIYSNGKTEEAMGAVLKGFPRHTLVLSTKLYFPMSEDVNDRGLSRKHIMESVHRSLKRIGTDYLDIYFCHRWDDETPLEETARAMDDLIRQGKVLSWGTSEWTGKQLAAMHKLPWTPAQVEQPQYSLMVRKKFEKDVRPVAKKHGMGLVVWSPLASGLLTGKYDNGIPEGSRLSQIGWLREKLATPENIARALKLKAVAEELGCTRSQLALAWAAAQDGVSSVITGATRLEQLKDNLGALSVKLDAALLRRLNALFPAK
jgi:voltage-dependent potassium channel beta subunit